MSSFSTQLKKQNQVLFTSRRPIAEELPLFLEEHPVDQIFFTREFSPEEVGDEREVRKIAENFGVKVFAIDQGTLVRENELPFSIEELPKIFTDYKNKLSKKQGWTHPNFTQAKLPPLLESLNQERFLSHSDSPNFIGQEDLARARLKDYLWITRSIENYANTRMGLVEGNDSTRLSAWLSAGVISPRTIHHELEKYESRNPGHQSSGQLRYELIWRDYFKFLARAFGEKTLSLQGLKNKVFDEVEGAEHRFELWTKGQTGQAFIDANIRQINQTGFMSDRGRQNVASFLVHHLQVPWTWGADYFERKLIDFDPDINNGNWLYLSGRGTDPRSRVFNPVKQAATYDPDQAFQNRWSTET